MATVWKYVLTSVFLLASWATAYAGETVIIEQDIAYAPAHVVLHLGESLQIVNRDPFEHKTRISLLDKAGHVRNIAWENEVEAPGGRFIFVPKQAGNYEIRCLLHDGMTADLIIKP